MFASNRAEVSHALNQASQGDRNVVNRLMPLVYRELQALAAHHLRRMPHPHTWQPTDLVNEVYLKLADAKKVGWRGRSHFFAMSAKAMREILVDHARNKSRKKRGGDRERIEFREDLLVSKHCNEDLLAVDEAIRKLGRLNWRQARMLELRFFGGLNVAEVAEVLGVSKRTIESEWTMVRAWLRRELGRDDGKA